MDAGALGFLMFSGVAAITNAAYDVLLLPLSKTKCRSGQKMTTHMGCQDKDAEPTGPAGRIAAPACCVLSVCAASLLAGPLVGMMLCVACCVLSLGVGIASGGTRQPAPQRQPADTPKQA